jgi:uncharacterized protein YegP (UPF0339 family)
MAAKFEIIKGKSGDLRFHLKAANGEIIASGQGYKTKAAAEKGIESVKGQRAWRRGGRQHCVVMPGGPAEIAGATAQPDHVKGTTK